MKTKACPIHVKAGPEDGLAEGEFLVYPSTFTRTPDSYGDVVAKGAFTETIAEWKESGKVLPGLYGHRLDDPDFFVASALEMGEDDHGWWIKGVFDLDSPKGPQVYRLVKGRRINQMSFAFDTLDEGAVELRGRRQGERAAKAQGVGVLVRAGRRESGHIHCRREGARRFHCGERQGGPGVVGEERDHHPRDRRPARSWCARTQKLDPQRWG